MNFNRLRTTIESDEGFRPRPYLDTKGVWTQGFGNTVVNGQKVTPNSPPVTLTTARHEMYADLFTACIDAERLFPKMSTYPEPVQHVLVEMAYQMGGDGLAGFINFGKHIQNHDWPRAALHIRKSLWYRQTPVRAERAAKRIEEAK